MFSLRNKKISLMNYPHSLSGHPCFVSLFKNSVESCTGDVRDLLLTLLHSERPKLYTILVFLSAVGLKERIFSWRFKI